MAKKKSDLAKIDPVKGVLWFRPSAVTRVEERKHELKIYFSDGGEPATLSGKELAQAREWVAAWCEDPTP